MHEFKLMARSAPSAFIYNVHGRFMNVREVSRNNTNRSLLSRMISRFLACSKPFHGVLQHCVRACIMFYLIPSENRWLFSALQIFIFNYRPSCISAVTTSFFAGVSILLQNGVDDYFYTNKYILNT